MARSSTPQMSLMRSPMIRIMAKVSSNCSGSSRPYMRRIRTRSIRTPTTTTTAVPALIAMTVILLPGIGLLSWRDFERDLAWSNFFVIATSLSLAHAVVSSGAAGWFANALVGNVGGLADSPLLLMLGLAVASVGVRIMTPNITGYLAFLIPIAMSTGLSLGLNPLVCGMAVVVIGDAVVFYPAGSTSSVFVYQRANISSPQVFCFGIVMSVVAVAVLFAIVLPYWNLIGEKLTL